MFQEADWPPGTPQLWGEATYNVQAVITCTHENLHHKKTTHNIQAVITCTHDNLHHKKSTHNVQAVITCTHENLNHKKSKRARSPEVAQKPGHTTGYSYKEFGKESPLLQGALQDFILDHSPQSTVCLSITVARKQLSQGAKHSGETKGLTVGS